VFDVNDLRRPLREDALKFDILDTMDVVAFPLGHDHPS
jgi:hypothetical protein